MNTKNFLHTKIAVILTLASLLAGITIAVSSYPLISAAGEKPSRKIVVFKENVSDSEKDEVMAKNRGNKLKHLKLVNGTVAEINSATLRSLKQDKRVLRVDEDVLVTTLARSINNKKAVTQPSEVIPWGINRVDADLSWGITTADTIKVGIIDTGISLSHPDLKNNIKGSYNTINPFKSAADGNGHGTHVAGTIGAIDNTIGVISVGPAIDLYAIKALNNNGSGYLSDIIEGLDWAIAKNLQVVNMSLGTASNIQSFHDAVIRAYNAGIVLVAAAGNDSGGPVNYPAAYPEVIAVSAIDSVNNIASFSSVGQEVDLAAPGVSIYSTYKGSGYATLSGTSMASPHVAGSAAMLLAIPSKCDTNLDTVCSPSEVKQRLEATAEDFGASGHDNQYGSGIVNAHRALTQ